LREHAAEQGVDPTITTRRLDIARFKPIQQWWEGPIASLQRDLGWVQIF
jgi:hypothetical protein